MMRKTILAFLCALLALNSLAQEKAVVSGWKPLEHNLMIGGGLFLESGNRAKDFGLALRVSYGLDIRFTERWSVMPAIGFCDRLGDIRHVGWIGGDIDVLKVADISLAARCRFAFDNMRVIAGLGPALLYVIDPDTYYIDADPGDPLNRKEKFKRFDFALRPSVTFPVGKHFLCGIESTVGLRNSLIQYPEYNRSGSVYLHELLLAVGWRF